MSPYKPHHDRVELEGLSPDLLIRGHSRNSKELRHPSDGAPSVYGRHRIAVVDFNVLWIHLLPLIFLWGVQSFAWREKLYSHGFFECLVHFICTHEDDYFTRYKATLVRDH